MKIKANNKNIIKHIANTMQDLQDGKISTEQAKQQANLIKEFNKSLYYELERAKVMAKYAGTIRQVEDDEVSALRSK